MRLALALLLSALAVSCAVGDDLAADDGLPVSAGDPDGGDNDGTGDDDEPTDDDPGIISCPRPPAAANRVRTVVVSHPYNADFGSANAYGVWQLALDGTLSNTGQRFSMGRATFVPPIAFSPDGEIGVAVQNNGTLGFFRVTSSGVQVIDPSFDDGGGLYAGSVLFDETGEWLYVLNGGWREHGGGIYLVHIECDGTPTGMGMVVPTKLASKLDWLPKGSGSSRRALLTAHDVGASPTNEEAHLLELGEPADAPTVIASASLFPYADAIISAAATTLDGKFALIGENSIVTDHSVISVSLGTNSITRLQSFTSIFDPAAIIMSPHGNAALVLSVEASAIYRLSYNSSNATTPFGTPVELSYVGGAVELPSNAVRVAAGTLVDLVLIAENEGIRRVRFTAAGSATDLGRSASLGAANMIGTIGVQP
jgi:hypothetical protein